MNYEIEQALRQKINDWELRAAEQRIRDVESRNRELTERIQHLEGRLSNQYSAIEQLIQLLIEKEEFEKENELLYQIRRYL